MSGPTKKELEERIEELEADLDEADMAVAQAEEDANRSIGAYKGQVTKLKAQVEELEKKLASAADADEIERLKAELEHERRYVRRR